MLHELQVQLESLYGVEAGIDIDDYVFTDRELLSHLDQDPDTPDIQEKLLVREHDDALELSLFIDQDVLDRLNDNDPRVCLSEDNLAPYWVALEGVSHFLYVVVNATNDDPITLLELELQAEVDKYVTSWHLADEDLTDRLHRLLFDETIFDPGLDPHGLERYRRANRYAGKYCHQLRRSLGRKETVSDLRHFYRLPQAGKIRHIEQ